jgi:general secretion pathway protein B
MSSILEALKKVEDEKAARQSGAGHIAGKVVKSGRRPKQRPNWMLPAGMASVAAVAVLVTYILMGGISPHTEMAPPAPAVQRQPAANPPLQPTAPTAPPSAAPSPAGRKKSRPPSSSPAAAKEAPAADTVTRPLQAVPATEVKPASSTRPAAVSGFPVLKVTGIGWQKDNANRLAVVNGRPVTQGSVIEGARVEEILPDRVRFSINDRSLEIPVGNIPGENQ